MQEVTAPQMVTKMIVHKSAVKMVEDLSSYAARCKVIFIPRQLRTHPLMKWDAGDYYGDKWDATKNYAYDAGTANHYVKHRSPFANPI